MDHPRSRGVYSAARTVRDSSRGSSPLARGLLRVVSLRSLNRRIIPARAGFTRQRRKRSGGPWDHPRSRGVYPCRWTPPIESVGSSPLARGLPSSTADDLRSLGIIPARAGFTCGDALYRPAMSDHPRSRGVYQPCTFTGVTETGSSPLARGLLGVRNVQERAFRIIPARAGFTEGEGWDVPFGQDHPRSRGVYRCGHGRSARHCGSSPLARGLRWGVFGLWVSGGIIPARAGFTVWSQRTARS